MTRSLLFTAVLCLSAAVQAQAPPVRWVRASPSLVDSVGLSADVLFRTPSGALVAGSYAGMYRSEADGRWTRVTQDSLRATQAAAWTSAGGTFYVAAGAFGVLASDDDGRSWRPAGLSGASVVGIAALPDGALVATGTFGQVYRREPASAEWTAVGRPGPACYSLGNNLKALADGLLLLTCERNLYRSADRGTTWTLTGQRSSGAIAQTPSGTVFLVRSNGSVARSLDSGVTWQTIGQSLTRWLSGRLEFGDDGFLYHAVLAEGQAGVARSPDGVSWEWVYRSAGFGYSPPSALLPPDGASPFLYLSGVDIGTGRIDLATGTAVGFNSGVFQEVPAAVIASAGSWTVFASPRSMYRTHNRGTSWASVPTPPGSQYVDALLVLDDGTILLGYGGTVSRTDDGGQTWTPASLPTAGTFGSGSVTTLFRARSGALIAGTRAHTSMPSYGYLFRSIDGGQSWVKSASTSQQTFGPVSTVVEAADGTLFAGQKLGGTEGASGALMRSDDDGQTWALVREDPIEAIAPVGDGRLLAVTFPGTTYTYQVARVSGSGAPWELLGLTSGPYPGLLRSAAGEVYLHDYLAGVRRTADGGDTWQTVADGLEDRRVLTLTQDADGFLYVGTPTGVFRSEVAAVAGAPGPEPVATSLGRPRPNPVRGVATLAFTLADAGDVDLGLYDVLGRRVATLARGAFGAGRHEASWSGSGLPAGTYLAVLRALGGVSSQPVTVAR